MHNLEKILLSFLCVLLVCGLFFRIIKNNKVQRLTWNIQQLEVPLHQEKKIILKTFELNTNLLMDWQKVPGIGLKKAKSIIEYKNKHGNFTSVEDLLKIKGIKGKTLENIKGYLH